MNPPNYRRLLLGLFAASLVISISGALIFSGLLLLLWLFDVVKAKSKPRFSSPLDIPILISCAWGVFSLILAGRPLTGAFGHLNAVLLFFLLAHGFKADEVEFTARWFCIAAAVVGLWGIFQMSLGVQFRPSELVFEVPEHFKRLPQTLIKFLAVRNGRAVGTRSHPLTYAESLIPAFFLLVASATGHHQDQRSPWQAKGKILAILFILGGMLASQSRGVWLGVGVGMLAVGLMNPTRNYLRLILALSLAAVLLLAVSPSMRGRLASIFSDAGGSSGDQRSKSVRLALWSEAFSQSKASPIYGVGLGSAEIKLTDVPREENKVWSEMHNIFLQSLIETGWIGLGLMLWIMVLASLSLWNAPSPWNVAAFAAWAAFLIAGLTESWMGDKEVALIFWALIGGMENLRLRLKEASHAH